VAAARPLDILATEAEENMPQTFFDFEDDDGT
jgi:hypothetical protein